MFSLFALIGMFVKDTMFFVSCIKNNAFPHPLNEKDEKECLEKMAEGDRHARNKLIEHNLRLVAHISKRL